MVHRKGGVMPKRAAGLTAKQVETITKTGAYADGDGLYLQITPTGSRSWIFRYSAAGKRKNIGLGPCRLVGLAEARKKVLDLRRVVTIDGRDPLADRRAGRASAAKAMTFRACAGQYIESHRAGWRSAKHAEAWMQSLNTFVYPVFGDLPVGAI